MPSLHALPAVKARLIASLVAILIAQWPAMLLFALSYFFLLYTKNSYAGACTLLIGLTVWLLHLGVRTRPKLRTALAYGVFFLTPLLTLTGQIGVLTGFGGSSVSLPWLGVSFVSAALAVHVLKGQLSFSALWLHLMQPLRWNSGPCALPSALGSAPPRRHAGGRRAWLRAWHYFGWLVLGAFFYGVLAAGIAPLLVLKESTHALDIVAFAVVFEFYVYFNFCGISFMVFGLFNLAGVKTVLNFKSPFAAEDVIDYWQRWHISLSAILKELFFKPLKARFGLPFAVCMVFVSSALWHGVSLNFVLWGMFHASGWLFTYALARALPWLCALAFPFIIVLGRLIFSEADSETLLFKFQQLIRFEWSSDAWLLHLTLDAKAAGILLAAAIYIAAEIMLPRLPGRFNSYKIMRNKWVIPVLLGACIMIGKTGLGGVYGAR